jgi:hypothetical protein
LALAPDALPHGDLARRLDNLRPQHELGQK